MTDTGTVIVGAGPAGLACAAALRKNGRSSLILESADNLAASWRRHYDRLHLHTAKAHSGLPGMPMPGEFPRYPSRLQVIDYLETYARANDVRIRFRKSVTRIRREQGWIVETIDGDAFDARTVVIATGLSKAPIRPVWKGQESFAGKILHSSEFANAKAFGGGRVLVVGFGNSAGEIALECAEEGLEIGISVRGPVNIVPLEMFGIPTATIAIAQRYFPYRLVDAVNAPLLRLRYRDMERLGLQKSTDGPLTNIAEKDRTPLIDIGTMAEIRVGKIRIYKGIESSDRQQVHFADGRSADFDIIVLATGYRPLLEAVLPDFAERFDGADRPKKGDLQPGSDGLYFCGFNPASTGLLRQIGIEAISIARSIAER
jgi:NADPH-dependent 2,4-dienoyl-CoA reductase/sulfur reductase-like enzyme